MKGLDLAGVHLRPKLVFPGRVRHEGTVLAPVLSAKLLDRFWIPRGYLIAWA